MADKYSDEDLVKRIKSPGWSLTGEKPVTGSLEDVAKQAHLDRSSGGRIREVETAIELDMIQIEKLWLYLGLPV